MLHSANTTHLLLIALYMSSLFCMSLVFVPRLLHWLVIMKIIKGWKAKNIWLVRGGIRRQPKVMFEKMFSPGSGMWSFHSARVVQRHFLSMADVPMAEYSRSTSTLLNVCINALNFLWWYYRRSRGFFDRCKKLKRTVQNEEMSQSINAG